MGNFFVTTMTWNEEKKIVKATIIFIRLLIYTGF